MKTATGLTLIIVGAILAFAFTVNTPVFNLHIAGYVLIVAGLAGMFIPRKNYASVSRRLVTRRSRSWPSGSAITSTQETEVPPYVVINPGSDVAENGMPAIPGIPPDPTVRSVMTPGEPPVTETDTETLQQLRDE
jgi:predicted signal transduction protein with EAL and GGDEF domain